MCTICALTIEFAVEHPQSLGVAVATRKAIDYGLLPPISVEGPDMAQSRHQAVVLLTTMQQRLEQVLSASRLLALPDFFVLMIESRTWGYFHPTLSGFDISANPSAPRIEADHDGLRDSIVVMSQAAAAELCGGRLPFTQAEQNGLVFLDTSESVPGLIRPALKTAYPAGQFSDFVCTEVA